MAASLAQSIKLLPKDPHSAIICGQTGCGKTVFILDLLEGVYKHVFHHIVFLCPTVLHNHTYKQCAWIWMDPDVYVLNTGQRLHECLRAFYMMFQGKPTLNIIDDCSAMKALTKKKDMLSELAFSGGHAEQSVWVLTQKYNSVLKDLREQTRGVTLFHCKDRNLYQECLCENDVIHLQEERELVHKKLAETKRAKLILKTDQPSAYILV